MKIFLAFSLINISFFSFVLAKDSSERSRNFTPKQLEKLKAKTKSNQEISYQDLAHENPGCPENSICSETMGKKTARWRKFIKNLENKSNKAKATNLEEFRKKHGLPTPFLTDRNSFIALDPILFNSRCKAHNPKDKTKTVYRGTQFFKNDPASEAARLDPVFIYDEGKLSGQSFKVPYEEIPLMIKNKKLVVARDYENLFYFMAISEDGTWRVVSPKKDDLVSARLALENAQCPKEDKTSPGKDHMKVFCKKIWNADLKKEQLARLSWACP